jgi:ATP-dependent DNA ligase
MKFDGHRTVIWRDADTVRLQARSGRDVAPVWMDLALAALDMLPPGLILDGEAVITPTAGSISRPRSRVPCPPLPARAVSPGPTRPLRGVGHPSPPRARRRPRTAYDDRRALLVDLLKENDVKPPIQLAPMTDDPAVAMTWHRQLPEKGIEGIVAKQAASVYRTTGRIWKKIRHAETVEADIVGYTGPATRPRALAVRLPDGRIALTQALKAPLASQVAMHLAASGPPHSTRTRMGEPHTAAAPGLMVEVLAGTTRHAVVFPVKLKCSDL